MSSCFEQANQDRCNRRCRKHRHKGHRRQRSTEHSDYNHKRGGSELHARAQPDGWDVLRARGSELDQHNEDQDRSQCAPHEESVPVRNAFVAVRENDLLDPYAKRGQANGQRKMRIDPDVRGASRRD